MKRRVGLIVLLLVAGAIINVAVAWSCAAWSPLHRSTDVGVRMNIKTEANWLSVRRASGLGLDRREIGVVFAPTSEPDSEGMIREQWGHSDEKAIPVGVQPRWSRLGIVKRADRNVVIEMEHVSGWPMSALWCSIIESENPRDGTRPWVECFDTDSAIMLATVPVQSEELLEARRLPLVPIWPGFAINTAFYAGILWAIFAAPFALRRRRRIKRGLCPACAYPVGENDVCTECGSPLPLKGEGRVRVDTT